jgi:hypothetical protein
MELPNPEADNTEQGTLTLPNGVYVGTIKHGAPNGNGVLTFKSGNIWEGRWVNGKRHGQGKMTYTDGNSVEGEWINDKLDNGSGTSPTFTGTWKNGAPFEGDAFFTYSSGDYYKGRIENFMMNGKGKYTQKDNKWTYDGEWLNDKRSGKGEIKNIDKTQYIGDWLNDKRNGKGKSEYPDGSIYDGDWENDNRSGKGKYIDKSQGSTYEGYWKYDKKRGQGKITYKDGSRFEGSWYDDMKHGGEGILTDANGVIITAGNWMLDRLSKEYPILKVSSDVFVEGCVTLMDLREWVNGDIIMLYNPPKFDVTKTIDSIAKFTPTICNYMFTREEIKGLKKIVYEEHDDENENENEDEDEDEGKNKVKIIRIENPYNRELMDPQHIKLYVLSIIGPPVLPPPPPVVAEGSSAGGKRRKTMKRRQKNKRKTTFKKGCAKTTFKKGCTKTFTK